MREVPRGRPGLILPALACLVVAMVPLISGARTLFLRDVFNLHLPLKVAQTSALLEGRLPLIDVGRAGGQPLLANPNAVALYPDNVLYLLAPILWSFNAHFWLHLLLAPFAAYWLARRLCFAAGPSWVLAIAYACSGYYLSHLNFYNLVAGVTLAPALVAGVLWALDLPNGARAPGRRLVAVALLIALLMLAGDPILLVLAMVAAAVVASITTTLPGEAGLRRALPPLVVSVLAAAALSAVQWLPFLETLRLSFRGHWGYGEAGALAASWDPRTVVEWLVPFAFGHPNLGFWGGRYYGGDLPLYFSLYPGAIALVLVSCSGRPGWSTPRGRTRLAGWALVAAGGFVALGDANPVVRLALELPGSGLLRFPVKAWLWVALGGSVLVGCGFERALEQDGRRALARATGVVVLLFLGLAAGLLQFGDAFTAWLGEHGVAERVAEIRPRWIGLALFAGAVAALPLLLTRFLRATAAASAVALVHAASQLVLLSPLYESDETSAYRDEPAALRYTREAESLVHGGTFELFGEHSAAVSFPSRSLRWVQRRGWNELYPFAGVQFSRRYELNLSPEGLDAFLTQMTAEALRGLDDRSRIKVLEALGVDALILDRPLDERALERVELRGSIDSFGARTFVYGLRSAPDVQVLGEVVRAPHLNASLQAMLADSFDPTRAVVVPGQGDRIVVDRSGGGEVLGVERHGDGLLVRVRADGPAVVLVQRAHLGQYRATVDGEPAPLVAGNMSRLAVEIGPGEHEVRLFVPRRTFYVALAGIPLGLALCCWLVVSSGAVARRAEREA